MQFNRKKKSTQNTGSSSVMQNLFDQVKKAKSEQQADGLFVTWKDMEDGQVAVAALDAEDYVTKTVPKNGKEYTFVQLPSSRVKVVNKVGKTVKLLEGEVHLPTTAFTRKKIDAAQDAGMTVMLMAEHEFVKRDSGPDFHKVVTDFGDDQSQLAKVLDE